MCPSPYVAHYNLITKLLNDRFGIQTRSGCSCAGTYGHFLLNVNKQSSKVIEQKILEGCLMERPGWIRMSIHPTMTDTEIEFVCDSIAAVATHFKEWGSVYSYDTVKNEFIPIGQRHDSIETPRHDLIEIARRI